MFVRTDNLATLEKALKTAKLDYTKQDGGLLVKDVKTDEIGKLASSSKLTVLELSAQTASLEKAFLELTEGSEEFRAQPDKEVQS